MKTLPRTIVSCLLGISLVIFLSTYSSYGQQAKSLDRVISGPDMEFLNEILDAAKVDLAKDKTGDKITVLKNVVIILRKNGKIEEATGPLANALYAAHVLDNTAKKARLFAEIAVEYNNLDMPKKSRGVFNQAILIADNLQSPNQKAAAYQGIASEYSKMGWKKEALDLLSKAMKEADSVSGNFEKVEFYAAIANDYFDIDEKDRAHKLLKNAHDLTRKMLPSNQKSKSLMAIAVTYAKCKDCHNAFIIAREIPNNSNQSEALKEITSHMVEY
jgi:tetratricopeptide (TPR) repeat protein